MASEPSTSRLLGLARDRLITVPEAAEILGTYEVAVRRMIKSGELTGIRVGGGKGFWVLDRHEVERRSREEE